MTNSDFPGEDLPEVSGMMDEGDISDLPELETVQLEGDINSLPELDSNSYNVSDLADDAFGDLSDNHGNAVHLELGESVTSEQAEALAESILQHRSSDLVIDASKLTRIDTNCIEVLLSAAKLWIADRNTLSLSNLTEEFSQALAMLGLDQSMLESGDC